MTLNDYESALIKICEAEFLSTMDPSHDHLHIKRVVKMAKLLAQYEKANLWIVIPAAYLHDIVSLPKNHPERQFASKHAADKALEILKELNYPEKYFNEIHHAVIAHSFSANIKAETIEAMCVQDADRLDAIGAIGIARMMTVNGMLRRPYYSEEEIVPISREVNDSAFALDHFYAKLFKLVDLMNTKTGIKIALERQAYMKKFIDLLKSEIEFTFI